MSGVPSSVKLQIITMVAPAKSPGRISGSVIFLNVRQRHRAQRADARHADCDAGAVDQPPSQFAVLKHCEKICDCEVAALLRRCVAEEPDPHDTIDRPE